MQLIKKILPYLLVIFLLYSSIVIRNYFWEGVFALNIFSVGRSYRYFVIIALVILVFILRGLPWFNKDKFNQ